MCVGRSGAVRPCASVTTRGAAVPTSGASETTRGAALPESGDCLRHAATEAALQRADAV
jgi:hypothetical protein